MDTCLIQKPSTKKIYIRLIEAPCDKKKTNPTNSLPSCITMGLNTYVKDLLHEIEHISGYSEEQINLFYDGTVLSSSKIPIFELLLMSNSVDGILKENEMSITYQIMDQIDESIPFISLHGCSYVPPEFQEALTACRIGFTQGLHPELALDGSGGTYFLRDRYRKKRLCFKPFDEEPYEVNNPRGFEGTGGCVGFRQGIHSGEGYKREIAAYLLDRSGFFRVPPTLPARIFHPSFSFLNDNPSPKLGSLQMFVDSRDIAGNWGPSKFSIQEVQKICLLDIYILNTDRNDANILLTDDDYSGHFSFIPVDHGYSLPDRPEISEYSWCWLDWPQVKQPWTPECQEYIRNINVDNDSYMLYTNLGIRKICLIYMRISGILLQLSLEYNLSPYQVACIYIRRGVGDEEKSRLDLILEQTVAVARDLYIQTKNKNRAVLYSSTSHMKKENDLFLSERQEIKRSKTSISLDKMNSSVYISDFQYNTKKKLLLEEITNNKEMRHIFFDNLKGFLHTLLYNIAKKEGTI
ncbi:hypothetical protein WA158_000130 [Blastocystis sp. Blastoise]